MSFLVCGASNSKRNKNKGLINRNKDLTIYKQKYHFSDNELLEFRQRFNYIANAQGLIDKPSFMESMGVLGLDIGSFLSDKIFHVIDKDGDGYLSLDEYLNYFNILIYGSQEEKHEITFRMIDVENKGWFHFDEFYEMIVSMLHTWNNITGHNYNVHQNRKLEIFLANVFQKFLVNEDERVTLESFKIAVSKEPQLLEIFDYFNEGIIDAVQPPSEFDQYNQQLIEDIEQLHVKIAQLKSILKGKNGLSEDTHLMLPRDKTPKTSIIPRSSVLQVHKPEDVPINSSHINNSPQIERRNSMLQSLDIKIKRTALFEHLREGSADNLVVRSALMTRPRSEIIRLDGENSHYSIHNTEGGDNNGFNYDYAFFQNRSAEKVSKRKSYNANQVGGFLNLSPDNNRKAFAFPHIRSYTHGTSPDRNQDMNNFLGVRYTHNPRLGGDDKQTSIPDQEQEDPEISKGSHDMGNSKSIEISPKNNLQIINEERTFEQTKVTFRKNEKSVNKPESHDLGLKFNKDMFLGVLLESPKAETFKSGNLNSLLQQIHEVNAEELQTKKSDYDCIHGFRFNRPTTVMIEPKFLDIEEIDITPSATLNEATFKAGGYEDVKLSESYLVPVKSSNVNNGRDERRRSVRSANPNLRINNERLTIYSNDKEYEPSNDERVQQALQHVESIASEAYKILEELHKKKRQANKTTKEEEDKKIEQMKEVTAHNIHKATITKAKTKKGNFVAFGHQNWNLVVNMMLGIQMAIKSAVESAENLSKKDFHIKYIFELVPKRTSEMKGAYKICKFFDYAPNIFLEIRRLFGINNEDYLKSIGPESMLNGLIKGNLSTLAELTSSGKSGSFFYYSADGKYTLKTISREEFHFLRKILKNYYNHIMDNPNTLIIKFFGLHKIRFMKGPQRKTKIYFIIMANVFNTTREIHIRYDLKGSTQGRITKDEDPTVAKKDLNIIQTKEKIKLTPEIAETFTQVIEKDSHFFEKNNIIDYSLLLGIHNLEQEELSTKDVSTFRKEAEFRTQSREGVLSADGSKIYFFGVIDILTEFNARKRAEYVVKRMAYGKGISAVPPANYSARFLKFIKGLVEVS